MCLKCTISVRVQAFSNSFFNRNVPKWNRLPLSIKEIDNSVRFERELRKFLWTGFVEEFDTGSDIEIDPEPTTAVIAWNIVVD